MDAVNELKGECKHKDTDTRTDAIYFRRSDMFGNYYYYGNDFPFHNEFVCTRKEFNDLVSQLETNFGVCELTYAKYKRAVTKSTKELQVMDEESNQCKISNLGNLLHNMSCSMDDEDEQNEFGGYASFCWYLADELRKSECAVDTTKLVFTQAMADNGESIKAGMLFQYNSGEKTELLLPIDESGMGVAMFDGEYCIVCQSGMLPIDTRTDKEKAIDAIDKLITNAYQETTDNFASNSRFRVEAEHLMDEIIDGTIAGVKWVGE